MNKFTWIPQMFKRTSWISIIMVKCLLFWYHCENGLELAYILNYLWHLWILKIINWIHNYKLWSWWVHLQVFYVLLHRGSCNMKSLPFGVKHFNLKWFHKFMYQNHIRIMKSHPMDLGYNMINKGVTKTTLLYPLLENYSLFMIICFSW